MVASLLGVTLADRDAGGRENPERGGAMADITISAVQADIAEVRPSLFRRLAWERMLALGFCAAFWAGVAYFVFH